MKKLLLTLLAMAALGCQAQTPTGWWLGILEEAGLPLNLQITTEEGQPNAFLYSPAQQKEPMKASSCTIAADTIRFESKPLKLKMRLVYDRNDSTWHCSFKQGLLSAKLTLHPTDTLYELRRPQTPKKPLPYDEKEVRVERKRADVVLTGTLTMPMEVDPGFTRGRKSKYPAVVLVSGSGQQNRDEELLGHKPFAVLADYLTRRGIAVLRYDDRGMGGSTGEVANATTLDFADDAEAMLEWLRKQPGIDPKRVGMIGHSEGGMIVPIVASRNRHVKFAVLLAGPGCSGRDVLLQQNESIYREAGADSTYLALRLSYLAALYDGDTNADKMLEGRDKESLKAVGLNKGAALMTKQQIAIPWMSTFIKLDPAPYLKKTRCPILAINGEKDVQVISQPNLQRIKELAPQAETHEMPGLNHLMQHCKSGMPSEYMLIEETMSEEVMELVERFVRKQ